jgi:chromosome segregation ATPase
MEFKLNETIENSVEKSKYRKLSKAYRELKENYDGIYEECEEMDKVIEKLELSNKTLTKKYEKTLSDFNSLKEGYTKIKKEHKSLVEDYNFLIDENEKLERKYESTVDSFEKKETLRKKRESEIERKKRLEAERLEAEREYELDKRIREKRIKESKVNWYEETQEQVKDYYYDLVRTRPSVVKIKEEILSCKNLEEAQNLYFKLDRELEKDENKISDMKYRRMESRDSDYEDGDDLVINHNYKDMNTRIKENKLYERDITGRETEDLDFNFTGEGFKLYEKENIQIPEHLSKIDESELEDLKF